MVGENPTWGGSRVRGGLPNFGFDLSEHTVSRYLRRRTPELLTYPSGKLSACSGRELCAGKNRTHFGVHRSSECSFPIQQVAQSPHFDRGLICWGFWPIRWVRPTERADILWCAPMSGKTRKTSTFSGACQEFCSHSSLTYLGKASPPAAGRETAVPH